MTLTALWVKYPHQRIGQVVVAVIPREDLDQRRAMAMLDDIFQGNVLTSVAVGLGAVLLAPLAGPVLRPAAKAVIKGGILAYQGLADLGEAVGDLVAEARYELTEPETAPETDTPQPRRSRPKSEVPNP
jgi:hypothetical protein